MTFYGRMHNVPEVAHQGNLLYSKAILQLAGKLNGGDEAFSTYVLAATLTLTVHEVNFSRLDLEISQIRRMLSLELLIVLKITSTD